MKRFARMVMGREIRAEITKLDHGMNALLTGGERSHIGAVTCLSPGEKPLTLQLPGHKEALISEEWAASLGEILKEPVWVECGIHYDRLNREQIQMVVEETKKLLEEVLESLKEASLSGSEIPED